MANTLGRVQDICDRLAQAFQRLVPLHAAPSKGARRPSDKEVKTTTERALQAFFDEARQERFTHRLGLIGRARVAFGVQQRLIKVGYPPSLVKQVLFAMLTAAFVGDKQ